MTQHLPPNLLALFQARPPIPYLPPIEKQKPPSYNGIAQFTSAFEDPATVDYSAFKKIETKEERKERKRKERLAKEEEKISKALKTWDPHKNPKATGDAYKTLFVSRLNYDTSESKIRREFEEYGPVKKIRVLYDSKSGKPRGYAFVEYEKERDMRSAYKHADGKKIDGRRVLVDVERGRTVKGWRPRRLGGGLGATRAGGDDVNQKYSGREPPTSQQAPAQDDKGDREHRDHRGGDRGRERDRDNHRGDRERDRGDRTERGDRPERSERPDRGDRDRERDRGDRDRGGDRDRERRH
jgi:U1 small nuclear ribonucleoprotein